MENSKKLLDYRCFLESDTESSIPAIQYNQYRNAASWRQGAARQGNQYLPAVRPKCASGTDQGSKPQGTDTSGNGCQERKVVRIRQIKAVRKLSTSNLHTAFILSGWIIFYL